MFRSSTIIRELALNLVKVIFMLKHWVKLHGYLLCRCVAACHGMACVLHAVQNATESYDFFFTKGIAKNGVLEASKFCVVAMFVVLDV